MEDRALSDIVWTPERGLEEPEVRGISWDNFLLSDDYSGKWRTAADIRVTPETAIESTVVLASCRILAETIATLPIHVYRRLDSGGKQIAKDLPLYKVLSFAPNGWQTKFEYFEQMVMNLCLWGNSYSQIKSGRYGAVSELINLHPSRMDVERLENGRLRYSYTNPETGRLERYTQDQIMHVRWTPQPDGIKGMVPVEIAREAIALARACETHAAKYWANSARPGVVLQTDGSLSAEAAERLRDNWERLHRGSQNAWRTAVLTNGLKAEPIGFSAEQSQAIESRRFSCEEIARVYRLPLHLIQGTSGGSLEVQGQEFVTYTLLPWLRRIESAISRSLIYNDDVFFAEFDVRGLLRSDSNSRASYYSTMTNLGIFSINECRALENLPPLEHGDNHFVAMNMQTLEEASKPKQDPMAAMMGAAAGGSPPPVQGGVPSLPDVKKGEAPRPGQKGIASERKPPSIKEGDIVTWGDGKIGEVQHVIEQGTLDLKSGEKIEVSPGEPVALIVDSESGEEVGVKVAELSAAKPRAASESRAFCPTGEGGGVDNTCGAKEKMAPDSGAGTGGGWRPKTLEQERLEAAGTWGNWDHHVEAPYDGGDHDGYLPDLIVDVAIPGTNGQMTSINVDDPDQVAQYITLAAQSAGMTPQEFMKSKKFGGSIHATTPSDKAKLFGGSQKKYDLKIHRTGGWGKKGNDSAAREIGSLLRAAGVRGDHLADAVREYAKKNGLDPKDAMYDGLNMFKRDPYEFADWARGMLDQYRPKKARRMHEQLTAFLSERRAFCPTGEGGGVDNSCSADDAGGGASSPPKSSSKTHEPDVTSDKNGDGVTDAARVGVPAMEVPPPPRIGRMPNLDPHERAVEDAFISHFESSPDKVASQFLEVVRKSGEPPTFGTDDAKVLTDAWSDPDPETRATNRATLNVALHQTANAIAKRAFIDHLDTLKEGDEIMVTVGGCGAGKGFALKNNPDALELKNRSKAVWDSAGDQNATENPWILAEAEKRGLKVTFAYVHADPKTQWADPNRGVVKRASDPKDGRMVDAKVFADSYAIGARNHHAFHQANKDNPNARFVFLDNTGKPKQIDGVPKEALDLDSDELAAFAEAEVEKSQAPDRVKRGALIGRRIWRKGKKG